MKPCFYAIYLIIFASLSPIAAFSNGSNAAAVFGCRSNQTLVYVPNARFPNDRSRGTYQCVARSPQAPATSGQAQNAGNGTSGVKSGAAKPPPKRPASRPTPSPIDCGNGFLPDDSGKGCTSVAKKCENYPDLPECSSLPLAERAGGESTAEPDVSGSRSDQGTTAGESVPQTKATDVSNSDRQNVDIVLGPNCLRVDNPDSAHNLQADGYEISNISHNGRTIQQACPPAAQAGKSTQTDPSAQAPAQCQVEFESLKKQCETQAAGAATECDQENKDMQDMSTALTMIGMGGGVSIKLACSKLGKISLVANGGFAAWKGACSAAQNSCVDMCRAAVAKLNSMRPCFSTDAEFSQFKITQSGEFGQKVTVCEGFKQRIAEAAQHSVAALAQAQAAKKMCDDVDSGLTTNSLDECKNNPTSPLCADMQRCSNPEFAASNPVCKCMANPNSQECMAQSMTGLRGIAGSSALPGAGGAGGGPDPGTALIDPAGDSTPGANPFAGAGGLGNAPEMGGQKGNAGVGGLSGGGTGGGGAGGSGSYGSGAGDPSSDRTKVNSGFYGGGASGGYFGGTPSSRGLNGGTGGVNGRARAAGQYGSNGFDPRKYIVGLNGGKEYLNSPNGNIFHIVSRRIDYKKPTLHLPEFTMKK